MLIQTRTIVVQKGYADAVVERFSSKGAVDEMEGLLDVSVMVNRSKKEDTEEVVAMIRWASVDAWKNWEKSDAHIQGHKENRGKTPPEYVVSSNVNMYEVKTVREGTYGK
ncbi:MULTISPECIES: antibiotic biosynthesis monooxygenase [Paenibacillus]|uniref:antibiotic biosynthesis monooxygenase n=1 Tax=Paenibacillus TaxID=44249 RepID=UPI0022B8D24C|nr:antibiotic biosynthesis monooxygenase [Paenibacillus caseinilyticus]MCZ8522939.1 antibiotic biosynthesis monooxygenase [Paenibacillus caseinilyticus]